MNTTNAILITQIPISVVMLIVIYELHKARKELVKILEKLAEKKQ